MSQHRSLLNKSPIELAARVEINQARSEGQEEEEDSQEEEEHKQEDEPQVMTDDEEEEPYSPPALEWDEQDPNEVQQEPPVDPLYCRFCLSTPCLFLQWQEEMEQSERLMYPYKTNRAKRLIFYQRVPRELNGHLGRGARKPLPHCFVQGARDLYPNGVADDVYTGFKRGPGGAGDESSIS
jgi:hypothetical protein